MASLCRTHPGGLTQRGAPRPLGRSCVANSISLPSLPSLPSQGPPVDCPRDSRRQLVIGLMTGMVGVWTTTMGQRVARADEYSDAEQSAQSVQSSASKATFKSLRDPTLAYSFEYPVMSSSGAALPMVVSRKPEKYSSAAPLTADARQRIVCELVSLMDALTVSVSVGPPSGTLRTTKPEDWTAKQLAEQVLLDRSTGRVTSGQRISLSTVESARFEERDGLKYCIYETISQGSPTMLSSTGTTYRHARAVTVMREGLDHEPFLYTLNVSCPQERWEDLEEPFMRAVESFKLEETGPGYIAPNQDPWKFF